MYLRRLLEIQSPDEFYTAMGLLSQEMLDGTVVDEDALIQVYRYIIYKDRRLHSLYIYIYIYIYIYYN